MEKIPEEQRLEELKGDLIEMKTSREKLLAEKFHLVSQTQVALRDNERLTDSNVALEGKVNDLKLDIERLREKVEAANYLQAENESLRKAVEASRNAEQLSEGRVKFLKSENKRLEEELDAPHKSETELDDLKLKNERLTEEVEAANNARLLAEKKLIDKLRETRDQGSTIKQLATQCGSVMGHQNHSQKIRYMVKLKNENVELKSKVVRLQTELSAARRNSARPLTARSIVGAAQNKDSATPRCSSTTSTTNTTAKTTLRPSVESATMAGSQARSTSGLGSRKGISKK